MMLGIQQGMLCTYSFLYATNDEQLNRNIVE